MEFLDPLKYSPEPPTQVGSWSFVQQIPQPDLLEDISGTDKWDVDRSRLGEAADHDAGPIPGKEVLGRKGWVGRDSDCSAILRNSCPADGESLSQTCSSEEAQKGQHQYSCHIVGWKQPGGSVALGSQGQ